MNQKSIEEVLETHFPGVYKSFGGVFPLDEAIKILQEEEFLEPKSFIVNTETTGFKGKNYTEKNV